MKKFKVIAVLFVILLSGITIAMVAYLKSVVPCEQGIMVFDDLSDTVEVRYDHYGVPHVFAQNDTDAYFALGFTVARERLFQMELLRRVGAGRLAEVFGKDLVKTDAFFRTLGFEKQAQSHAAAFMTNLQGDWQRKAVAYINGINRFMSEGPLPAEFQLLGISPEPFTPIDMYLISGYMAFSFTESLKIDPVMEHLKSLGPQYYRYVCPECADIAPDSSAMDASAKAQISLQVNAMQQALPFEIWTGSNAWVVSAARSSTKSVLFANDTHIGYQQPSVWFEAHLDYPGVNLYGKYISGMPFPMVGHNGVSAYGVTMLENDDVQLYREQEVDFKSYRYKNELKPFLTREEKIKVKDGIDTSIIIRESVHGPVVTDVIQAVDSLKMGTISLWWTYLQLPVMSFETTFGMAEAKNMEETRKAVSLLNAPGLNIAYGDTFGNIAVWAAARLPKYPMDSVSKFILNGSSGKYDVAAYFPFDANPHRVNPASGFVFSSNEALDTVTSNFPGYYPPFDRADQVAALLKSDSSITVADMATFMMHDVSTVHRSHARLLRQILEPLISGKASADELFGLFTLSNWNGGHGLDDPAPSVYYLTLAGVTEKMMEDEMGEALFEMFRNTHQMKCAYTALLSDPDAPWWDNRLTKDVVETRDQIVLEAFREAIRFLSTEFVNRRSWKWANMHSVEHKHALGQVKPLNLLFNIGPYAMQGGLETVNNMSFHMHSNARFQVAYGPAMRTIVDLADPENAISVLPTGQSGHLMSKHYNDQALLHAHGLFRPMLTDRKRIFHQSSGALMLLPKNR